MKIIIMSDSHGDLETVQAVSELQADAIFHCGDSELAYDHPLLQHMHRVKGNCDFDSDFPRSVLVTVGDKKILAVHGHEHQVNRSMLELNYAAKEAGADIVLFGHTHLYGAEMKDRILFLNPGSTVQPRGGKKATYAVIEWDETVVVTFINLKHEIVDQIEMKFISK